MEQLVEQHPVREHVGLVRVGLEEDLGAHVTRRAHRSGLLGAKARDKAEVPDLCVVARVEHDVGGLDVAVQQLAGVQICDPKGNLMREAHLHRGRQRHGALELPAGRAGGRAGCSCSSERRDARPLTRTHAPAGLRNFRVDEERVRRHAAAGADGALQHADRMGILKGRNGRKVDRGRSRQVEDFVQVERVDE